MKMKMKIPPPPHTESLPFPPKETGACLRLCCDLKNNTHTHTLLARCVQLQPPPCKGKCVLQPTVARALLKHTFFFYFTHYWIHIRRVLCGACTSNHGDVSDSLLMSISCWCSCEIREVKGGGGLYMQVLISSDLINLKSHSLVSCMNLSSSRLTDPCTRLHSAVVLCAHRSISSLSGCTLDMYMYTSTHLYIQAIIINRLSP